MTLAEPNQVTRIFQCLEANGVEKALAQCQEAGYRALFMPELIERRINADADSDIWTDGFNTPSIRVTGITKRGNAVVVYAHIPNYLSNPANITLARGQGLRKGAGIVPQEELNRLVDLENNRTVFIVDADILRSSSSGVISVSKALRHPQTIPFLGGQEKAERYMEKHQQVCGDKIGIWYCDDLAEVPRGRLLVVGGNLYGDGLDGNYSLDDCGRVFGVAPEALVARKNGGVQPVNGSHPSRDMPQEVLVRPTLEETVQTFLTVSKPYVPEVCRKQYETVIRETLDKLF